MKYIPEENIAYDPNAKYPHWFHETSVFYLLIYGDTIDFYNHFFFHIVYMKNVECNYSNDMKNYQNNVNDAYRFFFHVKYPSEIDYVNWTISYIQGGVFQCVEENEFTTLSSTQRDYRCRIFKDDFYRMENVYILIVK
jgi:hypothetical protein